MSRPAAGSPTTGSVGWPNIARRRASAAIHTLGAVGCPAPLPSPLSLFRVQRRNPSRQTVLAPPQSTRFQVLRERPLYEQTLLFPEIKCISRSRIYLLVLQQATPSRHRIKLHWMLGHGKFHMGWPSCLPDH